jgi:3-oxoacyl-(acyl-carrier-protein) synthase
MTAKGSANQPGHRVVVTGIGVVSPLGHDARSTWNALVGGKSGIAPITRFDPTGYQTTFAGEVKDFDPNARMGRKEARRTDRYTHFAVAAALEGLEQATPIGLASSLARVWGAQKRWTPVWRRYSLKDQVV